MIMTHAVSELAKANNNIQRVSDAANNLIAYKLYAFGKKDRVMSFHNPTLIV
jgi:hypothetical protein